jgi:hypothetical protein
MAQSDVLPVNFTISPAARTAIAQIRRDYDAQFPHDPAAVLSVAWGFYYADTPRQFENVVIAFYPQSMHAQIAHGIQEASGLELIFFITEEYHGKFAGKVLDYSEARRFFLRDP